MGIREARLRAGLSVREVMKEVGVSDAAVYQWETGVTTPRPKMLIRLSKLYGVTVDELLRHETMQNKTAEEKAPRPVRQHRPGHDTT